MDKTLPQGTENFLDSGNVEVELASCYWGDTALQKLANIYNCIFWVNWSEGSEQVVQFRDKLDVARSGFRAEDIKYQENFGQNADGSKSMIPEIQFNQQ